MNAISPSYEPPKLTSPELTGGAGFTFENRVVTWFATLMVCDGSLAMWPTFHIREIACQVRREYLLDDFMVTLEDANHQQRLLLAQIKRSITLSIGDPNFIKTIHAAWSDFKKAKNTFVDGTILSLITGPLNQTDNDRLGQLSSIAKNITSFELFNSMIQSGNNISKATKTLYQTICKIIEEHEGHNAEVSDVHAFLRQFYVFLPDTLADNGLLDSFAISLLKQTFPGDFYGSIYDGLYRLVDNLRNYGGAVSREDMLAKIINKYGVEPRNLTDEQPEVDQPVLQTAPLRTLGTESVPPTTLRSDHLALLALLGVWLDENGGDQGAVLRFLHVNEASLDAFLQVLSQRNPPTVTVDNGLVHIKNRVATWMANASTVSNTEIRRFLTETSLILKEKDQRLDIDPDERLFSEMGPGFSVSSILRRGIAEGLAILGVHFDLCAQVSLTDRDKLVPKAVSPLLSDTDWKTWASLDDLLPYLAEAAPDEYLASVNRFLQLKENGAGELFAQERPGLMGRTYLGGFIEALQRLAWLPQYFASVLDILARLAQIDPGGQIGPRPADIMQRILHPYGAHTTVEASVRMDVFSALLNKYPEPLWNVLVGLLPGDRYAFVEGAGEPIYRRPANMRKAGEGVTRAEAYEQFDRYGSMAVEQCGTDSDRMISLILSAIQYWRDEPFNALVKHLQQTAAVIPEEQRFVVWGKLRAQLRYLRSNDKTNAKFSDWLASRESAVLNLISLFEPQDPGFRCLPLFSYSVAYDDLDEAGNSRDEFRADIAKKQREAVEAVWKTSGTDGFLKFASRAEKSQLAGQFFGEVAPSSVDAELLPGKLRFDREGDYWPIAGYVAGRFGKEGWQWVDALVRDGWTREQRAMLLILLPFGRKTWHMVNTLLGKDDGLYWQHADPRGQMDDSNVEAAVSGFLKHGYHWKASEALSFASIGEKLPRADLSCRILSAFIKTPVLDHPNSMSDYHVEQMIKALQESADVDTKETARYEWHFFDLFDHGRGHDFFPVALNLELANDPQLFCEMLKLAFLTEAEAKIPIAEREEKTQSESERRRSTNAWRLLEDKWETIPGVDSTGTFNSTIFRNWVEVAFSKAKELDRLKAAKSVLGHVFSHSPEVSDFWMPHEVAELMEESGNEQMLRSFETAIFNSRGAHWVDPTLKADRDLADQYEEKAQRAERFGYLGIARAMRNLAKTTMDIARQGKESSDQRDTLYKALLEEKNGIHATEN